MAGAGAKASKDPPKQRNAEGPRFSALTPALRPESLEVLASQGFQRATPVQAAAIGLLAGNKDVSVEACTGSGKTLAFVLPLVEILARASREQAFRKHHVGAVVVSPTRELAKQIFDVAAPFMATLDGMAPPMLLVGGTDVNEDVRAFASAGRLLSSAPQAGSTTSCSAPPRSKPSDANSWSSTKPTGSSVWGSPGRSTPSSAGCPSNEEPACSARRRRMRLRNWRGRGFETR